MHKGIIEGFLSAPRLKVAQKERAVNGVSVPDTWNADRYLAWVIVNTITLYKKNLVSHPANLSFEEWNSILQEMIDSFTYYLDADEALDAEEEETLESYAKRFTDIELGRVDALHRGLDLLKEYFMHLWA
jgi:hypothetical protein